MSQKQRLVCICARLSEPFHLAQALKEVSFLPLASPTPPHPKVARSLWEDQEAR